MKLVDSYLYVFGSAFLNWVCLKWACQLQQGLILLCMPIHNFRKGQVKSVLFVGIISSCYFILLTLFYIFCCCFSANLCSRFTYFPFMLIICIACYKHTHLSKMHRTASLFTCSMFGLFLGLSVLLPSLALTFLEALGAYFLDVLLTRRSPLHLFFIFIILVF